MFWKPKEQSQAKMRNAIAMLTAMSNARQEQNAARNFSAGLLKMFRGSAANVAARVTGMNAVQAFTDAEYASWQQPEAIAEGASGPFDACDLRIWTLLAERAGVPAIPAVPLLSLNEEVLELISGKVDLSDTIGKAVDGNPEKVAEVRALLELDDLPEAKPSWGDIPDEVVHAQIGAMLYDALDDMPDGWMVRSHVCGTSVLKGFAGAGVLESTGKSGKIRQDIEVGPGWVRTGNRRRIDATDSKLIESFVGGHGADLHYLARPWVEAGRTRSGDDPLRHGTQFAGKGSWPCEWRVFIENNEVIGVSNYYGWLGEPSPLEASKALEAVAMAQKILDEVQASGLVAREMRMEQTRDAIAHRLARDPNDAHAAEMDALLRARFPENANGFTLDFLEGEDGMVLLEGGPAHAPTGGAHPCSFIGVGMEPGKGLFCDCRGVAFRMRDGIHLGEMAPKSLLESEDRGEILSFEEARALAAELDEKPSL